jgi:ABC-type uncharacterized transport system YnjBCD ATPase subunit
MIKMPTKKELLLEIQGLTVVFNEGVTLYIRALKEGYFTIVWREILGLVGKVGFGKSALLSVRDFFQGAFHLLGYCGSYLVGNPVHITAEKECIELYTIA